MIQKGVLDRVYLALSREGNTKKVGFFCFHYIKHTLFFSSIHQIFSLS